MSIKKERFSTLIRMPYQEGIRIILRVIDYHNRMILEDRKNAEFHMKQTHRLRAWMLDMKDYIQENERANNQT